MEDIIEKIACQFTARHIRGRPRPPYWYLGFPLYVCDSRYNDRDRVFVKIKNWNSCIPEEVRKSTEFMQIYPFERTVYPKRYPSPFLLMKGSRVKGPGGIVEEGISAKKVSGGNDSGPSRGQYVGPTTMKTATTTTTTQNAPPALTAPAPQQQQQQRQQPQQLHLVHQSIRPPGPDRSVITAAGGLAQGNNIQVEKLPPETSKNSVAFESKHSLTFFFFFSAKCFDRDPYTNEMLWFSGPPINIVRTPTAQHSPTYLYYLAMKRKRKQENGNGNEEEEQKQERGEIDSMGGVMTTTTTQGDEHRLDGDGDGVVTSSTKRLKVQQERVWPTVREMRRKLWVDMGMDKFS